MNNVEAKPAVSRFSAEILHLFAQILHGAIWPRVALRTRGAFLAACTSCSDQLLVQISAVLRNGYKIAPMHDSAVRKQGARATLCYKPAIKECAAEIQEMMFPLISRILTSKVCNTEERMGFAAILNHIALVHLKFANKACICFTRFLGIYSNKARILKKGSLMIDNYDHIHLPN